MTSTCRKFALAALAGVTAGCMSAAAADSVYTATSGRTCRKLPEGHLSGSRCEGPSGYSFVIRDDGNVVGVQFGPPGKERVVSGMHWRATGKLIGDRVEWRMAGGEPYAAIVRIFTLNDDEKPVQRLLVAKVSRTQSCEIAAIEAGRADANQMARRIADERAPTHECQEPR